MTLSIIPDPTQVPYHRGFNLVIHEDTGFFGWLFVSGELRYFATDHTIKKIDLAGTFYTIDDYNVGVPIPALNDVKDINVNAIIVNLGVPYGGGSLYSVSFTLIPAPIILLTAEATWQSVVSKTQNRFYTGALVSEITWKSETNPQALIVTGNLTTEATWQSDVSIVIHTKTTVSSEVVSLALYVPSAKSISSSETVDTIPKFPYSKSSVSSQVMDDVLDLPAEVPDSLTITETIGVSASYIRHVSDFIIFVEQTIEDGKVYASDVLDLSEDIGKSVTFKNSITEPLTLSQLISIARQFDLSDVLSLSEAGATESPVEDSLVLSDLASSTKQNGFASSLILVESATRQCVFNRSVVDTIDFSHGVFGSTFNKSVCAEAYSVTLGTRNILTVTYPYTSPSLTVNLRVPKFGNTDTVKTESIFRRTVGNQLLAGRASAWPKIELLKFSFEALTQAQRDAMLNFAKQSSGAEIGLLDQENRQWRGVITSPEIKVEQRSRTCDFLVDFEFRGSLV